MITTAFGNSRSEYNVGRPRRATGGGAGVRSMSCISPISRDGSATMRRPLYLGVATVWYGAVAPIPGRRGPSLMTGPRVVTCYVSCCAAKPGGAEGPGTR